MEQELRDLLQRLDAIERTLDARLGELTQLTNEFDSIDIESPMTALVDSLNTMEDTLDTWADLPEPLDALANEVDLELPDIQPSLDALDEVKARAERYAGELGGRMTALVEHMRTTGTRITGQSARWGEAVNVMAQQSEPQFLQRVEDLQQAANTAWEDIKAQLAQDGQAVMAYAPRLKQRLMQFGTKLTTLDDNVRDNFLNNQDDTEASLTRIKDEIATLLDDTVTDLDNQLNNNIDRIDRLLATIRQAVETLVAGQVVLSEATQTTGSGAQLAIEILNDIKELLGGVE
jgi:DNA repair exonuclease SbcCD ATPase subunit